MKDNYNDQNQLLLAEDGEEDIKDTEPVFRRPRRLFKKRRRLIILIALAVIIVIGSVTVLAFMLNRPEDVYDDSAAFYFSSNLLSEEGKEFTVYDSIEFNVYNYADALRTSAEPLDDFKVTVSAEGEDITSETEISTGEKSMVSGVRSGCTVIISVPEEYWNTPLDVTVVSSPIAKELHGRFTVLPEWGYELKDSEGNYTAELIIFANEKVAVEVEWNAEKLEPDSTNPYVEASQNNDKAVFTVELDAGTSASIPMFKIADISEKYDTDSKVITVKKTEKAVEEDTPAEDEAVDDVQLESASEEVE